MIVGMVVVVDIVVVIVTLIEKSNNMMVTTIGKIGNTKLPEEKLMVFEITDY